MKLTTYISALILTIFGLLTLYLSTSIIFDLFDVRAQQGNYVLFVIWTNFICSFIYLFASYGFIKRKKITTKVLGFALGLLIVTIIGFLIYINNGGIHKDTTIKALIFRTSFTLIFMVIAYYILTKKQISINSNMRP
jgi:drug/metabolite transporter (DMT)-like permease